MKNKKEAEDYLQSISSLRYGGNTEKELPSPFLSHTESKSTLAHNGDLIVITGVSKVGKSSVATALMSAALTVGRESKSVFGFDIHPNTNADGIVYFNTELGPVPFNDFNNAMLNRSGLKSLPANYSAYNLTTMFSAERRKHVGLILRATNLIMGLKLVVIDGVADLVLAPNHEEESNSLVDELMALATELKVPIITVIHQNSGERKLRGHLGSQLERKAQVVLEVLKGSNGVSWIKPMHLRGAPDFDAIGIEFDETEGYHVLVGTKSQLDVKVRAVKAESLKKQQREAVKEILSGGKRMKHSKLLKPISEKFEVGESQAKNLIKSLKENGIIKDDGDGYYLAD